MADSATARHDLVLMEVGQHENDWGQNANTIFQQLEDIARGSQSISTTGGTTALTKTTSREPIIRVSGTLSSNAVIEVPAAATSWWTVSNETSGNFTLTVKVNGQTGVVIQQGTTSLVRCNGSDVVKVTDLMPSGADVYASSVGGSVDALSLTVQSQPVGWVKGTLLVWPSLGPNTTTTPTIAIAGVSGTKPLALDAAGAELAAGDTGLANRVCFGVYNGSVVVLLNPKRQIVEADIADEAITSAKIAANAVTTTEIADNAVTTNEIADNAVTPAKLSQNLTQMTTQSLAGVNLRDFTSIPSWVKRITLSFFAMSHGTSNTNFLVRIGSGGAVSNTGYVAASMAPDVRNLFSTTGFIISGYTTVYKFNGNMILSRVGTGTDHKWVASFSGNMSEDTIWCSWGGGRKELPAALDIVRVTTEDGSAFDDGFVSLMYE